MFRELVPCGIQGRVSTKDLCITRSVENVKWVFSYWYVVHVAS